LGSRTIERIKAALWVGATGSPIGEAKVRFTTEGTRVIAVNSRHDGDFAYASQFLGTCE
jgi:hypothetical protein